MSNKNSTTASKRAIKSVILHAADINRMPTERFPDPSTGGDVGWKTLISAPGTPTDTFTVGVATCAPGLFSTCPAASKDTCSQSGGVGDGAGQLKLHRHTHAEIYHVVAGTGVVSVDQKEYEVGKGNVVFVPGDAEHGMRNTGREELRWLYVFAARGFEDVVYRFSGEEKLKSKL